MMGCAELPSGRLGACAVRAEDGSGGLLGRVAARAPRLERPARTRCFLRLPRPHPRRTPRRSPSSRPRTASKGTAVRAPARTTCRGLALWLPRGRRGRGRSSARRSTAARRVWRRTRPRRLWQATRRAWGGGGEGGGRVARTRTREACPHARVARADPLLRTRRARAGGCRRARARELGRWRLRARGGGPDAAARRRAPRDARSAG